MDFVKTGPVQFERIVVFHKVEHEYRIKNDFPLVYRFTIRL
jgi:hypothetical protein